ncbi:symplekin-like [Paramacrobiotus metropolitanus]|uniref:symplekin-like n=1 Tax=Paramacrobiotus metropolitanus TaxID=2943436 RepID=UPI002445D2AD|nr:symplekin-like [Paramacrobiotus metropolitanus]
MTGVVDNPQENEAVYQRVVGLMHAAQETGNDLDARLTHLLSAKEVILSKSPELIDNFWAEMVATRHTRKLKAVAFCLDWIRDACKKEPLLIKERNIFSKELLLRLMEDPAVVVQKRSLICATQIYRNAMRWICSGDVTEGNAEPVWQELRGVKEHLVQAISGAEHAENHVGYRLLSYKFLQTLIECQSPRDAAVPPDPEDNVSSLDIPDKWSGSKLSRRSVEAEASAMLDVLEGFVTRQTLTTEYVDCISVCGCLLGLARRRPQYLPRVMTAVEFLLTNIPAGYTKLHVEGLRKYLKTGLICVLRRCPDPEMLDRTVQLLTRHFGTSHNEIYRNRANITEMLRKKKREPEPEVVVKRPKLEDHYQDDEDEGEPEVAPRQAPEPLVDYQSLATEINTNTIVPRLTPDVVVRLIIANMRRLPTSIPTQFHATYTPIGSGPASGILEHLARLMALQMVAADVGPGSEEVAKRKKEESLRKNEEEDAKSAATAQPISSVLRAPPSEEAAALDLENGDADSGDEAAEGDTAGSVPEAVASGPVPEEFKATEKAFKLEEMTEAIPPDDRSNAILSIVNELIGSEPNVLNASAESLFHKCLVHFAVRVGLEALRERIAKFIMEDLGSRAELAFRWIFEEYAYARHIQRTGQPPPGAGENEEDLSEEQLASYDDCLTRFIKGFIDHPEYREGLVSQLYMEVPWVTEGAVELLSYYCTLRSVHGAMRLIHKLVSTRPRPARYILPALDLTLHQRKDIQAQAVQTCVKLYSSMPSLRPQVQTFAIDCMNMLGAGDPAALQQDKYGRAPEKKPEWNEDLQRICSSLFAGILAEDASLLPVLGEMYVQHANDVKKTIFKIVDLPVRTIGMNAPEMLAFVRNPPKGSEALVLRVIHLLTETNPPTAELISSIRGLYAERIPDVRFLIPILNGLPKEDIVAALPKLVKLNPVVVQEVFHRLLGTGKHKLDSTQRRPSLSPAEVLIELHKIDMTKVDAKSLIKATGLCLEEKELYPADTMMEVLKNLIDAEPLPFLLLRTVLQTVQLHGHRTTYFIMNILNKLIDREVWTYPLLWEGFVKCCEKTLPPSIPVLLRLPSERLKAALDSSPALRGPLQKHLLDLHAEQRAHLPPDTLQLLDLDRLLNQHREPREPEEPVPRTNDAPPKSPPAAARAVSPPGRRKEGRRSPSRSREPSSRPRERSRGAEKEKEGGKARERGERSRGSGETSRARREKGEREEGAERRRRGGRDRSRERKDGSGSRRRREERRKSARDNDEKPSAPLDNGVLAVDAESPPAADTGRPEPADPGNPEVAMDVGVVSEKPEETMEVGVAHDQPELGVVQDVAKDVPDVATPAEGVQDPPEPDAGMASPEVVAADAIPRPDSPQL